MPGDKLGLFFFRAMPSKHSLSLRSHLLSIYLRSSLKSVRTELLQQLQNLQGAPSVQMQQVPPAYERVVENPEAEDGDPDEKGDGDSGKTKKTHGSELYDKVD